MTRRIHTSAICLAILSFAFPCQAQNPQSPELDDVWGYLFRGLDIPDEPSIFDNCSGEYEAFRFFEYAVRPIGIIRAEKEDEIFRLSFRKFESGRNLETLARILDRTQWAELVDLFQSSGFWTAETNSTIWMPDSLAWVFEACYRGKYHSLKIYPERNIQMNAVTEHMVALKPRSALPAAEPVILGTDGAPTEVALNAVNVSSRNGLVKDANPITVQRLQVWLESTFLPPEDFLIRHRLVEIDGDALGAAIRASFEANSIANADGSSLGSSENSIIFDLFPDRSYQVVIDRISDGRYGYFNAHGTINRGDGYRSNINIQIAPNREITGTFISHDGMFNIRPSPEYPVHVVTEIDRKARQEKIVIY